MFSRVLTTILVAFTANPVFSGQIPDLAVAAGERSSPGVAGEATESAQDKLSAYMMHKTERMLKEQLSCLGCHQFGDEGGRLAPDLLQVKDRLSPAYVREFIVNPPGKLPETMMPAVRLQSAKLEALVSYLFQHQRPPGKPRQLESTQYNAPGTGERGKASVLFRHYCSACHGRLGRGDGINASSLAPPPTNLADAVRMQQRPDDTLFDIIATGGRFFDINPRMPAWGRTLTPGEIRGLVEYIRELCQCQGPDWSRQGG